MSEMGDFEDLDVTLVAYNTGETLPTFETSKTISKCSNRQRRYAVDAKPDQRFAIDIYTASSFDWKQCNAIEVKLGFDVGEEVNERSVYILKDKESVQGTELPYMTHINGTRSYRLDHILIADPGGYDGDVQCKHFYFRPLRSDKFMFSLHGLPRAFTSQGKIRVEIMRTMIKSRTLDAGPQIDTIPSYRREVRSKLLQRGITLEVLLHTVPSPGFQTFRGNFRSERPTIASQKANFDFIYREAGHHDAQVNPRNLEQVNCVKRSSSSAQQDLPVLDSREDSALISERTIAVPSARNNGPVDIGNAGDRSVKPVDQNIRSSPSAQTVHDHFTENSNCDILSRRPNSPPQFDSNVPSVSRVEEPSPIHLALTALTAIQNATQGSTKPSINLARPVLNNQDSLREESLGSESATLVEQEDSKLFETEMVRLLEAHEHRCKAVTAEMVSTSCHRSVHCVTIVKLL